MAKKERTFVIQHKYLMSLAQWLNEQMLHGPASRERSRFVKQLAVRLDENEAERLAILKRNTTTEKVDGKEVPKLDEEAANKDYSELMQEEFKMDITGANREQFDLIKDIVLNTRHQFGPREGQDEEQKRWEIRKANDYVAWCDAFEAV